MRSNKWLFLILYVIGVVLILSVFMAFVPPESRTNVKWMNLFIGLFIFSGVFGRYSLLYPLNGCFAENVPTMALYWTSFGVYIAASVAAMFLFWVLGVDFSKQALLQGVLLFGFVVCISIGIGASHFMAGESKRIEVEVGGTRAMQFKANQLKIALASLPPSHSFARAEFDKVVDAVTYMGGSNNPMARESEARIIALLDKLQMQADGMSPPDECLATVKSLSTAIAMRKTICNI